MSVYPSWKVTPFRKRNRPAERIAIKLGNSLLKGILCTNSEYSSIGVIRQGMSFGLLGIDKYGHYARVNGEYVERLETHLVTQLLGKNLVRYDEQQTFIESLPVPTNVTITVRKRRVY